MQNDLGFFGKELLELAEGIYGALFAPRIPVDGFVYDILNEPIGALGFEQPSIRENGAIEAGSGESCHLKVCATEVCVVAVCFDEGDFDEICVVEVCSAEVCEVEIGETEIWPGARMCFVSPIPGIYTLCKYFEMIWVNHGGPSQESNIPAYHLIAHDPGSGSDFFFQDLRSLSITSSIIFKVYK